MEPDDTFQEESTVPTLQESILTGSGPQLRLPGHTFDPESMFATSGTGQTDQDLAENPMGKQAVCLALKFSKPGNRKKLDNDSITTDADDSMLDHYKHLLDMPELKAVEKHDATITNYVKRKALTTKYLHAGLYLLPVGLVHEVDEQLERFREERAALIETAVDVYPERIQEAARRLNTYFNVNDYMSPEQFRKTFGFQVKYVNFGVPGTLKEVSQQIWEREREKAETQWTEAMVEIREALRGGLATMVERLVNNLSVGEDGKKKRLYDTTVTHLKEFLDTFDARNLTGDSELSSVVEQARALIAGVEPETLRKGEFLRETVRSGFESLQSELSQLQTKTTIRKIRLEDDDA